MMYIKKTLNRYSEILGSNKIKIMLTSRGFHAIVVYRFSNYLYSKKIPLIPTILTRLIQIIYSIDIDYRAKIEPGLIILHGMGLTIGNGVEIGSNCLIFHGVTIGAKFGKLKGLPKIGNNVLIGTGSVILGPIEIASNSKIGANSVVLKSFTTESSLIAGNPAKFIKSLL